MEGDGGITARKGTGEGGGESAIVKINVCDWMIAGLEASPDSYSVSVQLSQSFELSTVNGIERIYNLGL